MPRKGNSVRDCKLSRTLNDLQIRTQMIPAKKMKWHGLFQRKVKNIKGDFTQKSKFYHLKRNIPLFEGHWLRKTLLQCVYWNRGHPNNENQSAGRIETIDSNIFKSSQSNVLYKTMESQLVPCDAYAITVSLINKFKFKPLVLSRAWILLYQEPMIVCCDF